MQGAKVRGIYLVAAISGALAIAVGILVAAWMSLPVRPSDAPAFASRIVVPEAFRRKIVLLWKDGETEERDGPELYRESFVSGWNDCLEAFVADWKSGTTPIWSHEPGGEMGFEPWLIGAPDEINVARRDGWRSCAASLKKALKARSEADLRATLARSPGDLVPAP